MRLADHAGLTEASRRGDVVPALLCADDDAMRASNVRRASYASGAVAALARDLRARGTQLVCRRGPLVPTALALAREAGAATVTWSARYDAAAMREDAALRDALEGAGLAVVAVHDAPAVAPQATAARRPDGGRGYRAFAPYATVWAQCARLETSDRIAFATHDLRGDPLPDDDGDAQGESSDPAVALAAFDRYLAAPILAYPIASTIPASEPTARVSAALSFGVLSARTLLARVEARALDPFLLTEEKYALATFVRALARRDFFLQLGWFFDDEPDRALQPRMREFPFATDHPALAAWRAGTTGLPLVDAGMRQLAATGWMHPRVRLVAASFCCFDLGIDWRVGRDLWDAALVEDDGALASGNWQWVAGVGADLAQFPRIYNPRKQLRSLDPAGTYVRRWIPELAQTSDADLFDRTPDLRPQLPLGLYADATYPAPVVDHDVAARAFLARYVAFIAANRARGVAAAPAPKSSAG
ncbi:MAG: deoxyribodipyrimidine photo-lyase [Vulcanimicrobiaceae bacterium]